MRTLLVLLILCALVWQSGALWRRRRRRTTSRCWSWPSKGIHVNRFGCNWPFSHGETCYFQCQPGYGFHSGSSSRQCNNGAWTGSKYICRRCTFPPGVQPWHHSQRSGCGWPYLHNEQCTFTCQPGYTYVSGDSTRTCKNNNGLAGYWTGSPYKCRRGWFWG